jgi:hypothetical protein
MRGGAKRHDVRLLGSCGRPQVFNAKVPTRRDGRGADRLRSRWALYLMVRPLEVRINHMNHVNQVFEGAAP